MEQPKDNWKATTLIIGGIIGLISGIIAAYIFIQRAEEEASRPRISAGEGVKSGIGGFRIIAPGFRYAQQELIFNFLAAVFLRISEKPQLFL